MMEERYAEAPEAWDSFKGRLLRGVWSFPCEEIVIDGQIGLLDVDFGPFGFFIQDDCADPGKILRGAVLVNNILEIGSAEGLILQGMADGGGHLSRAVEMDQVLDFA